MELADRRGLDQAASIVEVFDTRIVRDEHGSCSGAYRPGPAATAWLPADPGVELESVAVSRSARLGLHCQGSECHRPQGRTREEDVVDTTLLRALRLGPEIHVLLRSLVLNRNLVPPEGVFLNFTSELPAPLGEALDGIQRAGKSWCAWRDGDQVRAVSAEIDEGLTPMVGHPVVRLSQHDAAGRIVETTCWYESEPDKWTACDLG